MTEVVVLLLMMYAGIHAKRDSERLLCQRDGLGWLERQLVQRGVGHKPPPPGREPLTKAPPRQQLPRTQGWAQGSFVEAEAEVKAERLRQRRGKAAMSLTETRQGRGRELEAEARQTKFEADASRLHP